MLFIINAMDKDDGAALRQATRPAHFEYAEKSGQVRLGGPYLDHAGNMIGSMIILEAESLAAAEEWARNDPYAKAGLFQSTSVTMWKATANFCGADF